MRYDNEKCPVCLDIFQSGDDIVVCPECGTPHHRECWKKNNLCGNSQSHEEGFMWQPENASSEESGFDQNKQLGIICSVCGNNCPPDFNSCPVCSNPLNKPHESHNPEKFCGEEISFKTPFDSERQIFFGSLPCPPDTAIDSVTAKDATIYIQVNSKRYITKYLRNKKLSWNWGAFFFAPYWFFFRKIFKLGIVFASIFVALSILTTVTMGGEFDTFMSLTQKIGNTADVYSWSQEQQKEYMDLFFNLMKACAPFIAANLLVRIACALSANPVYRKKMNEDIKSIRSESADEGEVGFRLLKKGGVSAMAAITSFLASNVLQNAIIQLIN